MDFIGGAGSYLIPFLIVLTVLVFVHELGHYWVARRCGVRVEVFSIGFGPELFGWTAKSGTRWKFSAVPLGGYVKMFGDANAASAPGDTTGLTEDEKAVAFPHKTLGQRAAIVAAGPIANFVFAIVVLAGLFMTSGHPFPPPTVGEVQPGSAAAEAGFQPGDQIVAVDGDRIYRFAELAVMVQRHGAAGEAMAVTVEGADGDARTLDVTPRQTAFETPDGETVQLYRIGIAAETGPYGPIRAVGEAAQETVSLTALTLSALGEMVIGERGTEELGGPIRIAQLSGDVAQIGVVALIWFMAILSINLGLINLFPVPMLDGGHLMFYAAEAVRGRPLSERAQEYGFRIGLALVLTLMLFVTWNDLVHLRVFDFLKGMIS
ncbi:MAG: RIP metalloprotease RseP [Deinococcus-Thermus bacterium]|jgi:regulator of sigma E protease|nr:RIP metalloprotease RseP [Deinococcota bacterium]